MPFLIYLRKANVRFACSAEANPAYDQIPLCSFHFRQGEIQSTKWALTHFCSAYEDSTFLQCL